MIKEIVLKIDSKTIRLTVKEARKLKDELDQLFGKNYAWPPPQVVTLPYPDPYPNKPYWEGFCDRTCTPLPEPTKYTIEVT